MAITASSKYLGDSIGPMFEITFTSTYQYDIGGPIYRVDDETGEIAPVRGAGTILGGQTLKFIDVELPLGRKVWYGFYAQGQVWRRVSVGPTVSDGVSWLSDVANPVSCIPVHCGEWHDTALFGTRQHPDMPHLTPATLASVSRERAGSTVLPMGASAPVDMGGPLLAPSDVPLQIVTTTAEQRKRLNRLLENARQLLYRPAPCQQKLVGPLVYFRPRVTPSWPQPAAEPERVVWDLVGPQVQPLPLSIFFPPLTYETVQAALSGWTYKQVKDSMASRGYTYADFQRWLVEVVGVAAR